MLQSLKAVRGYRISAVDGEIGAVDEFYFDDAKWGVRYLVVDTGSWLSGRRVLLSPSAASPVDWYGRRIPVSLTREQVRTGPGVAADKPVSRQQEERLAAHYGWPAYWTSGMFLNEALFAAPPIVDEPSAAPARESPADPHLRSAREVTGYRIQASDGEIGAVEDFVFDDEGWEIRYLVVEAGSWLHGKRVLLKPRWVRAIEWEERRVRVNLSCETIRRSPEFMPVFPLPEEYVEQLDRHYEEEGE